MGQRPKGKGIRFLMRAFLNGLRINPRLNRMLLFLVVYLAVGLMLAVKLLPAGVALREGQASLTFIGAPRRVQDRHTTEALRQVAQSAVGSVYDQDHTVFPKIYEQVDEIFALFATVSRQDISRHDQLSLVRAGAPFALTDQTIVTGLALREAGRDRLLREINLVLEPMYLLGIKPDRLELARGRVREQLGALTLPLEQRALLSEIVPPLIIHNLVLNEQATANAREAAASAVNAVYLQVGQKIIGQGEIATEREITILADLGLLRDGPDYRAVLGVALLTLLIVAFPLAYFYFQQLAIFNATPQLGLIAVICLGVSLVALAFSSAAGYLMPIATAGMLVTVLIGARVGLVLAVSMSLVAAGFTNFEASIFIPALAGAVAGVYAVSNIELRRSLVRSGMIVGLVNGVGIITFALLIGQELRIALWDILLGLGNGLLSAVLTIGFLPFLETTFGVVSSLKLAELANPQQPLLKKLLIEAPGTYHHSLIVANLAEVAAEQVGADALLARVGAYYHDIGKVEHPYYFIENQLVAENPHDNYPPHLSSQIITRHVKDGVRLAGEYKLPGIIVDIVREHHGTSVAHYFFSKALKADPETKEQDFCYEGPKPRSKEAAIVMLADIVEAAVRAMTNPSLGKIEQRVRNLLRDKLHSGQLDSCDLTFRQIEVIGTAFIQHLSGVFHRRVEYPELQGGMVLDAGQLEQRTRGAVVTK